MNAQASCQDGKLSRQQLQSLRRRAWGLSRQFYEGAFAALIDHAINHGLESALNLDPRSDELNEPANENQFRSDDSAPDSPFPR